MESDRTYVVTIVVVDGIDEIDNVTASADTLDEAVALATDGLEVEHR